MPTLSEIMLKQYEEQNRGYMQELMNLRNDGLSEVNAAQISRENQIKALRDAQNNPKIESLRDALINANMRNNALNAPIGGVGNVSNQEMQMFKANPLEYMREYSPTTREETVRKNMEYNAAIREMRALQHKGASGMGILSDAEVARFQQLQRGIGNVSDRENITLQEMIDVIQRKRNPYVDHYADAPGPTNEDLSARDREFLRQIGINNTNETYYNNLKNYGN
tara:strand:- start:1781 stop:2452 length:672 start_codon:yes stop_codon:yes gene_type:complete